MNEDKEGLKSLSSACPQAKVEVDNKNVGSIVVRLGNELWIKASEWKSARLPASLDESNLATFLDEVSNLADAKKVTEAIANHDYVRPMVFFNVIANPAIVITAPLKDPLSKVAKEVVLFSAVFAKVIAQSVSWFLLFDELGRSSFPKAEFALEELSEKEILNFFNMNLEQAKYIIKKVEKYFHVKFGKENEEDKFEECAKFLAQNKRAYKVVPALKDPNFLRYFEWQKDIVERITNWKGAKDERLALVHKAHLLRGINPKINPHGLTVTPPGTGKSTFYEKVGINLGRVTAISFTGYARSPEEIYPSIVNEMDEPINVDEIENESAFFVAQHLNNILEFGHDRISSGAASFEISCKSTFNFSANPVGASKDPAKSFGALLSRLAYNPAIGRRIALLLYISPSNSSNFKKISSKLSNYEEEQWSALVRLFRIIEEYARPKIEKVVEFSWSWINAPMDWYEKEVFHIISQYEGEAPQNVIEFLKAHIYATSRIRAGALHIAIVNNLDKIALAEDISKEFVDQLLEEAGDILPKLIDINLQSIRNIAQALGEELETAASIFYEVAPEYLKVILEACVAFKQKNPDADKVQVLQIPYETKVQEYQFLSQAVDRLKRRKKTENLFEEAKRLFGIDFVFQEGQLFAYFVNQNYSKIKPRGQIVQSPLSDIGEIEKSEKLRSSEEGEKVGASFTKAIHKDSTVSEAKIDGEIGETKIIKSQVSILEKNLLSKPKTPENHELEEKEQKIKVLLQVSNQKEAQNVEKDHEFLQFSSFSISQSIERIRKTKALPLKRSLCWRCYNRLSPDDQKQYKLTNHNGTCDICGFWEVGLYELKEAS